MLIVFYISGHGFGHASRDVQVVNALFRRHPDVRVVIRSAVPRWFLDASLDAPADVQHAETDSGMAQIDSLALDEDETARRAAAFYSTFSARADAEASALRQLKASMVVADIPPLAFEGAGRAGIPSVAFGNFTWDWIYEAYPQFESLAPGVLTTIREAYARATAALRLPLHGGFAPMRQVVRDVPLVARRSKRPGLETRGILRIDAGRPLVLASFGGHNTRLPYAEIANSGRFTLLLTDHELPDTVSVADRSRLRCLTVAEMRARQLHYEDLVAASDVVVSKPGYGIVSECVANDTALLYTSRGRFAEYDLFVNEMPRILRCRHLSIDDLRAGRWSDAVDALLKQQDPVERLEANGADVTAEAIVNLA